MVGENDVSDRYYPDENRALSDAVLEAIEKHQGRDLTKGSFQLYDDVDPDALDRIFREDANADTTIQFDTGDVTVTLWGDGGVEIRVTANHDG